MFRDDEEPRFLSFSLEWLFLTSRVNKEEGSVVFSWWSWHDVFCLEKTTVLGWGKKMQKAVRNEILWRSKKMSSSLKSCIPLGSSLPRVFGLQKSKTKTFSCNNTLCQTKQSPYHLVLWDKSYVWIDIDSKTASVRRKASFRQERMSSMIELIPRTNHCVTFVLLLSILFFFLPCLLRFECVCVCLLLCLLISFFRENVSSDSLYHRVSCHLCHESLYTKSSWMSFAQTVCQKYCRTFCYRVKSMLRKKEEM